MVLLKKFVININFIKSDSKKQIKKSINEKKYIIKNKMNNKKGIFKCFVLTIITAILIIVCLSIGKVIKVKKHYKNGPQETIAINKSKNLILFSKKLTQSFIVVKKEYNGSFVLGENKKFATINLNSLQIPNSTKTLSGKSLIVSNGTMGGINGISSKFTGNLLTALKLSIINPYNPAVPLIFTIQENSKRNTITLNIINSDILMTSAPTFDLPLAW